MLHVLAQDRLYRRWQKTKSGAGSDRCRKRSIVSVQLHQWSVKTGVRRPRRIPGSGTHRWALRLPLLFYLEQPPEGDHKGSPSADLPVFKTIVDDLPQFFRANISRTVDEQALLFERAVNQRWYVCLPVTQGGQAILDASITHH